MDGNAFLIVLLLVGFMALIVLYTVKTNRDITENPNLNFFEKIQALNDRDRAKRGNRSPKSLKDAFLLRMPSEADALKDEFEIRYMRGKINSVDSYSNAELQERIDQMLMSNEKVRGAKLDNLEKEMLIREIIDRLKK
jgi:hypothetical protein